MKITVTAYDFERAFVDAGRMDQFSYEGRAVLFAYLEELEQNSCDELELEAVREYLMDNGAYVGEVADGFVYSAF